MKSFAKFVPLFALLLLTGCIVPSLHQLYTEEDLIFDQALLGGWVNEDSSEFLFFEMSDENGYKLIFSEGDSECEFEARLLKIGKTMFLDLFPFKSNQDWSECHLLLPTHLFLLVKQIEPTLQLATLDPDWLKKMLERNPAAIRQERCRVSCEKLLGKLL